MSRFTRLRMRRRTAETPAPAFNNSPVITSAQAGVYKEGVLLTIGAPDVTPATAQITYRWLRDGSAISGANGADYLPVTADVGADLSCRITATSFGSSTDYTSAAVGPIIVADSTPVLGDAYDGVHADTLAKRAAIVAMFDGRWEGYQDQTLASTQTATSITDLNNKVAALSDTTGWHEVICDSTSAEANWHGALSIRGSLNTNNPELVTGHLYGGDRDFVAGGGGVLIRSSDPANPVKIGPTSGTSENRITGFRGVEIRDVILSNPVGGDNIFIAKDSIGGAGERAAEAPVVRLVGCKIGSYYKQATIDTETVGHGVRSTSAAEQIDIINCTFYGCNNGVSVSEGAFFRVWGNDFQQCRTDTRAIYAKDLNTDFNSAMPNRTVVWNRLNTIRNMTNVASAAAEHADLQQHGQTANVQDTFSLAEFDVAQVQRPDAYRDMLRITPARDPVDGDTIVLKGQTFTFRDNPTLSTEARIVYDTGDPSDVVTTSTYTNMRDIAVNSGLVPNLRAGLRTGSYIEFHFDANEADLTPNYSQGGSHSYTRLASGMQGWLNADGGRVDQVVICCITTCIQNGGVLFNGVSMHDRCAVARMGKVAPGAKLAVAGFDDVGDFDAHLRSQVTSGYPVGEHYVRNSVVSHLVDRILGNGFNYDEDNVYTGGDRGDYVLTLDNNRYPKWTVSDGKTVMSILNGPFDDTTDTDGRVQYEVQNDGLDSQATFRANMYSILKLANTTDRASIGPTDPATWPDVVPS